MLVMLSCSDAGVNFCMHASRSLIPYSLIVWYIVQHITDHSSGFANHAISPVSITQDTGFGHCEVTCMTWDHALMRLWYRYMLISTGGYLSYYIADFKQALHNYNLQKLKAMMMISKQGQQSWILKFKKKAKYFNLHALVK